MRFADFNLRIGYPSSYEIEAGGSLTKYVEVLDPNSLVYIGFATSSNDITLKIYKYVQDMPVVEVEEGSDLDKEQSNFKLIQNIEKIDASVTPLKVT